MKVIPLWRERRKRRGLNVREVAEALGITHSAVSQIEHGHVYASRAVLGKACEFFDCQPSDLYIAVPTDLLKSELTSP